LPWDTYATTKPYYQGKGLFSLIDFDSHIRFLASLRNDSGGGVLALWPYREQQDFSLALEMTEGGARNDSGGRSK